MVKKFQIKASSISGKGYFSTQNIKKGETINILKGELVSEEEIDRRIADGRERRDDPLQIDNNIFIDLNEESRAINHSCNPNTGIRKDSELFAIKDIKKGEEIAFDYSTVVGKQTASEWVMRCQCGSKNCRREIKDYLSIPRNQLKAYYQLGAFPDFILREVRHLL